MIIMLPLSFYFYNMKMLENILLYHSSIKAFISYNIIAGCIGFYLNFAQIWVCSLTSATTIALIGAMNKIPITIVGFIVFDDMPNITAYGLIYIAIGIIGGLLHAHSTFEKKKLTL